MPAKPADTSPENWASETEPARWSYFSLGLEMIRRGLNALRWTAAHRSRWKAESKVIARLRQRGGFAADSFVRDRAIRFPIGRLMPADARKSNRDMVAEALTKAEIPFFVVRKGSQGRTALGVGPDHHQGTLRAIKSSLSDQAFYCILITEEEVGDSPVRLLATVSLAELQEAHTLRLWRFFGLPDRNISYGRQYACDLEFWTESEEVAGHLEAPQPNALSSSVPCSELNHIVEDPDSGWPMPSVFLRKTPSDVDFRIDVVYTWVDDSDPEWQERRATASLGSGVHHRVATTKERFRNRDELKYSLRSLEMYAPWVNHIYLVTDAQVPEFLSKPDDWLTIVDHRDIAPPEAQLPVFNSNAIVCWLHRIPGLCEHYLYLNDDMFFGRDVEPGLFFSANGLAYLFPSRNCRPLGSSSPDDEPHINLSRNIRSLLESEFGQTLSKAIKHTPYPQLKSVHEEMENRFREAYERTAGSKFRHHDDIVADQLFHYYADMTGKAVESQISYAYINVGDSSYLAEMDELASRRHRDVFCLNDAPAPSLVPIPDETVITFLEDYFPVASRWEKPARTAAVS
jgi:hypothetical protein